MKWTHAYIIAILCTVYPTITSIRPNPPPTTPPTPLNTHPKSSITTIKVDNLAIVRHAKIEDLSNRLNVVTGETGAGKSLVTSAISLACGDAATLTTLSSTSPPTTPPPPTSVEMSLTLNGDDRDLVEWKLKKIGMGEVGKQVKENGILTVNRIIRTTSSSKIRSSACLNSTPCTLKNLKYIVSPLIAVVDANAAATALSMMSRRIKALDRGVDKHVLVEASGSCRKYREMRNERMKISRDMKARVPPSFSGMNVENEGDEGILRHWVEELDDFEEKWKGWRVRIGEELMDVGVDKKGDDDNDPQSSFSSPPSLYSCRRMIEDVEWDTTTDGGFDAIISLKDAIKKFESTYESAEEALSSLTSKSTYESAISSIEKARDYLYDVTADPNSPLYSDAEKSHDMLNEVEESLMKVAGFVEGKIIGRMERERPYIGVEELEDFVLEWKTLARKHQVQPEQLSSSHIGLKSELEGATENKERLPRAIEEEKRALYEYQKSCKKLTEERKRVGKELGGKVTERLKELGMEGAEFNVDVRCKMNVDYGADGYESKGLWGGKVTEDIVGVDVVDFLLKNNNEEGEGMGGNVEDVASSGERARILLLIETCLPGSIGGGGVNDIEGNDLGGDEEDARGALLQSNAKPVMVLYDEIDSHVGGRAAVAVAKLLSSQGTVGNQIISITHSAAIASIANKHLVVEKTQDPEVLKGGGVNVKVQEVHGGEREEEIARMAGGEMVGAEEGAEFAKALLQEGLKQRESV